MRAGARHDALRRCRAALCLAVSICCFTSCQRQSAGVYIFRYELRLRHCAAAPLAADFAALQSGRVPRSRRFRASWHGCATLLLRYCVPPRHEASDAMPAYAVIFTRLQAAFSGGSCKVAA